MTDSTIADTILSQLGGNRFVSMTGASSLSFTDNSLSFRLKQRGICRPTNNAFAVRIVLESDDTYTMTFLFMNSKNCNISDDVHTGLYWDMLTEVFTQETGLDTHL